MIRIGSRSASRSTGPACGRQLASRARRRIQGERAVPNADLSQQREVVNAFLAAARDRDFDALVAVLDPDVVVRADQGAVPAGTSREVRGAEAVARQALMYARLDLETRPALVNGVAGAITTRNGQPFSIGAFTVRNGKIVEIDFLADRERLSQLDLTMLES